MAELMAILLFVSICVALMAVVVGAAGAQTVKVGEGSYLLAPKSGEKTPPAAPHRTAEMLKTAAQTNQWYSTLIFDATPEVVFAQPLTVKIASTGVEVALPGKEVVPTVRRDVEIHYPHRDPLVFSPLAFAVGPHKLAKASDWAIECVGMRTWPSSRFPTSWPGGCGVPVASGCFALSRNPGGYSSAMSPAIAA